MTIINPVVPIGSYVPPYLPLGNITPFTYRDGLDYLEVLECIRQYLNDTLITFINDNVVQLGQDFADQVNILLARVDTAIADVNTALVEMNSDLVAAQAAQAGAEAARDQAEQYASSAADAQDSAITAIFNNLASAFRRAADTAYAKAADVAALTTLVDTGRLSDTALSALFDEKANQSDFQPVEDAVNTGRLSSATLDSRFTGVIDDTAPHSTSAYSSLKVEALDAARVLWGYYANRPAPNTVKAGVLYSCTDIPELYLNTGNAWVVTGAGGNEIGYAEQVPLVSNTATAPIDVPGFTTTFVVGERPIIVDLFVQLAMDVTTSVGDVFINLDGSRIGKIMWTQGFANIWETHSFHRAIHNLVPGSTHTITVQIARDPSGTGTALIAADTTSPNNLSVRTL